MQGIDLGVARIAQGRRDVDLPGGGDAAESAGRGVAAPAPDAGQRLQGVALPVQIERCVEDHPVADQPRRIVARRIIIVGAEMVGVFEAQPPAAVEPEAVDLRAAAAIAVADDDDAVAREQHLVIPVAARADPRRKSVDRIDRPHAAAGQRDREQPAAAQDDQNVAADLDDAALVDIGFLRIGDARLGDARAGDRDCRRGIGHRRGGRRGSYGNRRRNVMLHVGLLASPQAAKIGFQLRIRAEGGQALARHGAGGGIIFLGGGGRSEGEQAGQAGKGEPNAAARLKRERDGRHMHGMSPRGPGFPGMSIHYIMGGCLQAANAPARFPLRIGPPTS